MSNALSVRGLELHLGGRQILCGIDLEVPAGTTLGVVGESGSGKSTLAKCLVGQHRPAPGQVEVNGIDLGAASRRDLAAVRRAVQLVPQDPYSSLNPRRTVGQALAEALAPRRPSVRRHREQIAHWLRIVGLPAEAMDRHPHAFSGGQRQRVAIARGLAADPEVLIADEITSALDVSVQAEILELIASLREQLRLTIVFISHNLAVVEQVSDRVAVLRHGALVELGTAEQIFTRPRDPYTRTLLDSVPGAPGFSLT